MTLRLKEMYVLQAGMLALLVLRASVTFTVFAFLQIVSYLVLGLCILSFLIMLGVCLRKPRMNRLDVWITAYFILLIVLSLLNGTYVKGAVYQALCIFLLLMLLSYFKDKFAFTLKVCALSFSAIIYANLAIMIMFPDWMFAAKDTFYSYLLGLNYNQIGVRLLCGLITNILCLRFSKKWLINIIPLAVVSLTTLILVGSMTSLTCITIFLLFCLVPWRGLQKVGMVSFFCVYILFQVIVVFGGVGLYNNEFATYFVEQVLGKSMSFSFRTSMWAAAGNLFMQSPIWGYGYASTEWWLSHLSSFAIGPHNFIYSILLNGGVLLFSVFVAVCVETGRRVFSHRLSWHELILVMGIEVWLFMGLMEVYPSFFIFYLLLLAYYYPSLNEKAPAAITEGRRDEDGRE